jgi:NDP-sugar pyrophosphorylase family protein
LIVVSHLADQVAQHVQDHSRLYVVCQQAPFSLSGALAAAASYVMRPTIVFHGDNFFARNPALLLPDAPPNVFLHDANGADDPSDRWAAAGAYRLTRRAFQQLNASPCRDSLRAVIDTLCLAGLPLGGRPASVWRRNINTLDDLLATQQHILDHWENTAHPPEAEMGHMLTPAGCDIVPPVWIDPTADVAASRIGPYATVGPRARVRGARISEAVVFPDAQVRGAVVTHCAVVGEMAYAGTP